MICGICGKKGVFVKKITYVAQKVFIKKHIFAIDLLEHHDHCFKIKFNEILRKEFPLPTLDKESLSRNKNSLSRGEVVDIYIYDETLNRCLTCEFYGRGLSSVFVEFPTPDPYGATISYVVGHEHCLKKKIKEVQTELLGWF